MFYSNCRSLLNKLPLLYHLLDSKKFHVLLFCETWLQDIHTDNLLNSSSGYNVFRYDRKTRGGGVCIFTHPNLQIRNHKSGCHHLIEYVFIELCCTNKPARICVIYIPPQFPKNNSSIDELMYVLDEINSFNGDVFLFGDFNIPIAPSAENLSNIFIYFNENIETLGLKQIVKNPTRQSHILDFVLTNNSEIINNLSIKENFGTSDHKSIEVSLCCSSISHNVHIRKFDYLHGNYTGLNSYFANTNWKAIFSNPHDINELYEKFLQIVQLGISKFIPLKKSRTRKMPLHIRNLENYISKLTPHLHHNKVRLKYEYAMKKLNLKIRRYYINRENAILKLSPQLLYKYVSQNIHAKKHKISTISANSRTITNDRDIANCFQEFFCNVFQSAPPATSLPNTPPDFQFDYGLMFIKEPMIFDTLEKCPLKINESPDGLNYYLIRKCSVSLTKPITFLLRYSFLYSVLPSNWKMAYIIPIPKSPNAVDINNFRPISLTSPISKIAENLVSCELTSFIERFDHLPSFQHGFRSKRSVDSLMTETLDDITRAIDLKLNCDIIYFDIAKAFDTIEIDRIITKLSNMGITGNLLSWLNNFLSNRQIRVSVNGTLSDKFSAFINRGVPQGSVLGPLIFNLYMSDVAHNFPYSNDIIIKRHMQMTTKPIIFMTP